MLFPEIEESKDSSRVALIGALEIALRQSSAAYAIAPAGARWVHADTFLGTGRFRSRYAAGGSGGDDQVRALAASGVR